MKKLLNSKIEILSESSSYPRKNDCYKVNVIYEDGKSITNDYMPKSLYHLINTIKPFKDRLSEEELINLVINIEKYGDYKYEEATDDYHMANCGEDL